jgi:hypothetical protein
LDPFGNPHLTAWDQLLPGYVNAIAGPADADRAYNIAVYNFSMSAPGVVDFSSVGYGLGGFDSVVSVFQGLGNSASYLSHQYAPLVAGDFSFGLNLGAGEYTLAISMTFNEPCAAGFCLGTGTFEDGFTNLVNYDPSRSLYYEVVVTGINKIPEPATGVLVTLALAAVLAGKRWSSRARY